MNTDHSGVLISGLPSVPPLYYQTVKQWNHCLEFLNLERILLSFWVSGTNSENNL